MNEVKITHITTIDLSLRYLLLNQLCALKKFGYIVVGISASGPDVSEIEHVGIRHIAVPMKRQLSPMADLVTLLRLYRIMRRERFTIVHTHTPKAGLLGQLAARIARVPIVINTLHGFYFHEHMSPISRYLYIQLEKIAASCSDIILSQNSEDIQTAINKRICSPDKIKHLGNGIDLSLFDPGTIATTALHRKRLDLGIAETDLVVGFVGRLAARRKGFLDFLRSGQMLTQKLPNIRFLIIGDSDAGKPDSVEPIAAREYGIEDRCIFLGWQPNVELPILYSLMNVLVLPSLFEGLPRTLMEASAMCVPVVASNVKGNREAIVHNHNGFLVELKNEQALTDAIFNLLRDPGKAKQMGQKGRQLALERFDEQLVFGKVKAEYQRLLSEHGLSDVEPRSISNSIF